MKENKLFLMSLIESIKKVVKVVIPEQLYVDLLLCRNRLYLKINPKGCISMLFRSVMGYDMSWENPQDLNEKINWMKLNSDTSQWVRLGDKYRVREFLKERGYEELLVPLIGKWDSIDDVNWETLPQQFVMKMNNGSGDILICKDKSMLDLEYWKKRYKVLFKKKFGLDMGELHYAEMKPCLIAEEMLDSAKQSFLSSSLVDYKLWCFDGDVASIYVCFDRKTDTIKVASFDTNWVKHPEHCLNTRHCIMSDDELPRPSSLERMIQVASDLSKGFPQVRIDFYEVDGKLYFGEMTFTSNSGFMNYFSREYMKELGKKVKL